MKKDHRSYRRKPEKIQACTGFFFSDFLFATAKVASTTSMIFFHIIIHPTDLIYDFDIFITSVSSL